MSAHERASQLPPESLAEFELFVALVDRTSYVPFPEEDHDEIRDHRVSMAMSNRAAGLDPGPLGDLLRDYALEKRIPADVLRAILLELLELLR